MLEALIAGQVSLRAGGPGPRIDARQKSALQEALTAQIEALTARIEEVIALSPAISLMRSPISAAPARRS